MNYSEWAEYLNETYQFIDGTVPVGVINAILKDWESSEDDLQDIIDHCIGEYLLD